MQYVYITSSAVTLHFKSSKDTGVPTVVQEVKDLVLPDVEKVIAVDWIQFLAWELSYATGAAKNTKVPKIHTWQKHITNTMYAEVEAGPCLPSPGPRIVPLCFLVFVG